MLLRFYIKDFVAYHRLGFLSEGIREAGVVADVQGNRANVV